MSLTEKLTENEERLIAKEIVKLLLQKGVSYAQAESILELVNSKMRNVPITSCSKGQYGCNYTDRPDTK